MSRPTGPDPNPSEFGRASYHDIREVRREPSAREAEPAPFGPGELPPRPVPRRVCAWCPGTPVIDGFGPILPGETVSHGMCSPCATRLHRGIHGDGVSDEERRELIG